MVETGRIDIITEVFMLSSHMAMPREGHIEAVFRTFSYLNSKHTMLMIFDPSYADIKMEQFKICNWNSVL